MDNYQKLQNQIIIRTILVIFWSSAISVIFAWGIWFALDAHPAIALIGGLTVSGILSVCLAYILAPGLLTPIRTLWQAVLHVSPNSHSVTPPNLDQVKLGRELVTSLALQVYELARHENKQSEEEGSRHSQQVIQATNVVSNLPLPMFVLNKQRIVTSASNNGIEYCKLDSSELFGKPLFDSLQLEFGSDSTLEAWMDLVQKDKINDRNYWERVRVRVAGQSEPLQCDLAAYFDRDNPSGTEFIITLFDRTERYEQDDKAMNFVAMAVHELRTPLTILRGYIEVFEEELADKLDGELKDFMYKMQVSAEQLTSFVNNILNVARIENDQLELTLHEENWGDLLKQIVEDNNLRAKVHGKNIALTIDTDLPNVAVDRVSIYEVVSNLLDNAIKYSANSKEIVVKTSLGKNGMVETTVRDFGVGIPESVLSNLFEKFYRNHRTRSSIGGTGLGLYLSKAIINAHGGQIWAESKEAAGSTFGFSLQPYSEAHDLKEKDKDITRAAHGWVKNHTLYRR